MIPSIATGPTAGTTTTITVTQAKTAAVVPTCIRYDGGTVPFAPVVAYAQRRTVHASGDYTNLSRSLCRLVGLEDTCNDKQLTVRWALVEQPREHAHLEASEAAGRE